MVESAESGAVLQRSPDSGHGPLDALFFVVIALFLGRPQHECLLQQLHYSQICASAGVFTKHVLAWTRIPFTALLLVSFTFLWVLCSSWFGSHSYCIDAGLGSVAGDWQRDVHQTLEIYWTWYSILGGNDSPQYTAPAPYTCLGM